MIYRSVNINKKIQNLLFLLTTLLLCMYIRSHTCTKHRISIEELLHIQTLYMNVL